MPAHSTSYQTPIKNPAKKRGFLLSKEAYVPFIFYLKAAFRTPPIHPPNHTPHLVLYALPQLEVIA